MNPIIQNALEGAAFLGGAVFACVFTIIVGSLLLRWTKSKPTPFEKSIIEWTNLNIQQRQRQLEHLETVAQQLNAIRTQQCNDGRQLLGLLGELNATLQRRVHVAKDMFRLQSSLHRGCCRVSPADLLNVIFWKIPVAPGAYNVKQDAEFYVAELADKGIHVEFRDNIFVDVTPAAPPPPPAGGG